MNTRTETARQGNLCPHINHLCGPGQSPQALCKCCKRDHRHCRSHFTGAIDSGSCCCSSAHPATSFAAGTNITIICPPPPPPTTATTVAGRQAMIKYCKNMILQDPAADAFKECDERTPTRVLATAVFCTLEKHFFDETTPRA